MFWRKSSDIIQHFEADAELQDTRRENDTGTQVSLDANGIVAVERAMYVFKTHRGLKSRHIQLIALGGSIGTGLFVGTGTTLSLAGPAPLFMCESPQASSRY